ncbi:MAG: hypothetical protein MUC50_17015 [Myxococcota bacterium]|jgi:hypothetical protein|nr:hypothetical protein [Myxococcota bacterium]
MRMSALLALLALGGMGCLPSHAGRTLGKGALQAEMGLGGPIFNNLGGPIPMPSLPLGARYGILDDLDISAHINALTLVVGGFLTADAQATFRLVGDERREGFHMASSTGLGLLTDFSQMVRVSPLFDLAMSYGFSKAAPFIGSELILDVWNGTVIWNPFIGVEVDVGRTTLSLAGVWFNAGFDTSSTPLEWVSPGDRGALGVLLGLKIGLLSRQGKKASK